MDEENNTPNTTEEIFTDFKGRRNGLIKALTTDFDEFCDRFDPAIQRLCLYGLPSEQWEVKPPPEGPPQGPPQPTVGINSARVHMEENGAWLALVAHQSDAWLLSVSFYYGARLNQADRRNLFDMINDLPTIFEVVIGISFMTKPSVTNHSGEAVTGIPPVTNPFVTNHSGSSSSKVKVVPPQGSSEIMSKVLTRNDVNSRELVVPVDSQNMLIKNKTKGKNSIGFTAVCLTKDISFPEHENEIEFILHERSDHCKFGRGWPAIKKHFGIEKNKPGGTIFMFRKEDDPWEKIYVYYYDSVKKVELTPEELEKHKKNEEKAKEKRLKKGKAAQKAEALEAQKASSAPKADKKKALLGEKNKLSRHMALAYNPSVVEKALYPRWEKARFFEADSSSSKPPFTIVLPLFNVKESLHIGHALTAVKQDLLIRFYRMSGYNAWWVPGMDHAGVAMEVQECMAEHGIGVTIEKQLRRLGASLDWSHKCFTMDNQSRAVTEAFVRLYEKGLIYRGLRHVNWDCVLQTEIFDTEIKYMDIKERTPLQVPGYEELVEFGFLTSFAYPLEAGGELVVATTRVETMLGDTAIAIHPEDSRYSHLHGAYAIHPFNSRKIPIVCDAERVDMNFGTGAVKITPAHDPKDFEVGKRHNLDVINIFTDDGKIHKNGGSVFAGMPRFKARVELTDALKEKGLYRGDQNIEMRLVLCSKTNDVVEPLLKCQWYVNCISNAADGLKAVTDEKNPRIEIIPKQYAAEWKRWLENIRENIREQCVSRQLWCGHRIPAWYAVLDEDELTEIGAYDNNWVVARNKKEAEEKASRVFSGKNFHLLQDPDVLDTWFSAGLFPLAVLGWPDDTQDCRVFFPTSVLETGDDLLSVASTVILGMKLGDNVPLKVYLNPISCDAHEHTMSKSLGNVIDPLEVIDECGADALRFALIQRMAVRCCRSWCNKIWEDVRFAITKLEEDYSPPADIVPADMPFSCKWILSVLNKAISRTVSSLESYHLSDAARGVESWWDDELCLFIKVIEPYFTSNDPAFSSARRSAQYTLWLCLDNGLRLVHPFMPFITEELWQLLHPGESIMISDYPSMEECWSNDVVERDMEMIESMAKSLSSKYRAAEVPRKKRPLNFDRTHARNLLENYEMEISGLSGSNVENFVPGLRRRICYQVECMECVCKSMRM